MSFFNVGRDEIHFSAKAYPAPNGEPPIVITGTHGCYPTMGIHLSIEDAVRVAAELTDAVAAHQQRVAEQVLETPEQSAAIVHANLLAMGSQGLSGQVPA